MKLMFGFGRKNRRRKPLRQRLEVLVKKIGALGRRSLPIAFLLAVAIGLPYGIFHAYIRTVSGTYFQLEELEVDGHQYVDHAEIVERAGLVEGLNIFDIDLDRADRVLEAHPWIRSAHIERRLPDSISVTITEQEPVALLIDDRYHLVDADGQVFKALEGEDPIDELLALPMVSGLRADALETPEGRAIFLEAMDVVHHYRQMGLSDWEPLSEVHVDTVLGLTLVTADTGVEIRLGRGRYRERLERLKVVQQTIAQRAMEVEYILIDQESDLSRVAVGRRHQSRSDIGEAERAD
jgi:cell division protein FtsQ